MEKQELMYEGKAKRVYKTDSAGVLWIEYKDSATAFNGEKKSEIAGKGQLNNEITSLIFARLKEFGIESHFIEKISGYEQLVQQVSIIPLEVVTRNIVAGSLANRLGLEEGTRLKQPIVEFYYKNDELGDPLITEDHIEVLEIASLQELALLKQQALKINDILSKIFLELGVRLVDFKLEFGKDTRGAILLADEISPDTCRLWDKKTNQKLDKDVFRRDLGDITIVYQEILNRLKGETTHV
ncbi:phosphoribosylaminoimidazolesuccinocarboxamide synthase [Heyndrickxia oleronia]|jgi:phosphoribosylaminoimidazole-succinocarboxamide synthase|uniref:phosphoribosylaminoimidazolesuccinocarboxamide synthase n=1 Tax=Heyndrickxia oleronia TaxID=38875 RepID=UPI0007172DAD|nr:phosphoribosylaminoimidazolesuccinocarboxamide synthase [Heyndrickxia oleronia]MCI1589858.1 phosphoribosylaminoimidazolesuccinocarboxamide synthase [Heyndrickxia oleronia]MCI1613434.1 phosphoribosylaminoimidazolesuccinocarboxamide synthase [Heyndrickxia oleronia]MCI1744451.1 phosphoribosylaminoimidazolesuccinocarboxamide synthase [Heyndrickxia oleronia]MCI1763756.1 phosphoribosylaminoimidazolesuccinocarboxamide synthase [Heyndrickxia oleronia]MCM3455310.1 phosphoribosylaminoimidazolesuccino